MLDLIGAICIQLALFVLTYNFVRNLYKSRVAREQNNNKELSQELCNLGLALSWIHTAMIWNEECCCSPDYCIQWIPRATEARVYRE